jgi:hypothetical protein
MSDNLVSPAVQTARETTSEPGMVILANGLRAKLVPVPAAVISEVTSRVKEPDVPMWADPERDGRLVQNPNDPEYIKAQKDVDQQRTNGMLDAAALFGIELFDPIPPQKTWLSKLKMLKIDISAYNLEDELELEFVYKRFILATGDVLSEIMRLSTVSAGDINRADASFRRA